MDLPARPYVFFFTHVPKCGGTTVDRVCSRLAGKATQYHREGQRRPANSMTEAERAQRLFVSGHFPWDASVVSLFPQKPLFISTVRDPVARLVSYYSYQRMKAELPGSPAHLQAYLSTSLDDFAELSADRFASRLSMCNFFGHTPLSADAKAVIRDRYLLVASLPSISRFVNLIARYMQGNDVPVEVGVARSSSSGRFRLDPAIEKRVRDRLAEDVELVAWVERNEDEFFARAAEMLDPIAEHLVARAPRRPREVPIEPERAA